VATTLRLDLQGARELRARLKAMRQIFKPIGREWADATATSAKRRIQAAGAVDTGKTVGSIRRRNASQRKATVVGHYPINFIDAGTRAHDIVPKKARMLRFEDRGGRTVFARKVHKRAQPARPFKAAAARDGLRDTNLRERLIELWNRAA
jgi:hypothetical protein